MRENSLIRPPVSADAQRIRERLGKLIDLLIEEAGSERALGRLTKIGSNSIARWRNQTNWAQLDKLTQFAYSIGWTVTELMEFAESNEDVKQFLERKKFAKKQFSS